MTIDFVEKPLMPERWIADDLHLAHRSKTGGETRPGYVLHGGPQASSIIVVAQNADLAILQVKTPPYDARQLGGMDNYQSFFSSCSSPAGRNLVQL